MKRNLKNGIVIALSALHLTFLMAYSFPDRIVPDKLRMIAQLYVRPLFHQQWKLFAPDPPLCSCAIEWSEDQIDWRSIEGGNYLEDRIAQSLARHAQAALRSKSGSVDPLLMDAMRKTVEVEDEARITFRLKEECVIDVGSPVERETRITAMGS